MKIYQYNHKNVGDNLTKPILEHFLNITIEVVDPWIKNKLLGVGSIIHFAAENDIIWGSGLISNNPVQLKNCNILALRGKHSANLLKSDCNVFGDPAVLLPLIYNPPIEKIHKIGIIEHYVDKGLYIGDGHRIDVLLDWKSFVNELKTCEYIKSSSLHGLILAEAYDIPCEWITLSNNIIGNGFKFRDYLSASNRTEFSQSFDLSAIQNNLLKILMEYYAKHN